MRRWEPRYEVRAAGEGLGVFWATLSHLVQPAGEWVGALHLALPEAGRSSVGFGLVGTFLLFTAELLHCHCSPAHSHGVSGLGSAESQVPLPQVVFRIVLEAGP